MTYGLQVFDSGGNLEIDISSRLAKLIGTVQAVIPSQPYASSITYQTYTFMGISNDGNWFIFGLTDGIGITINNNSFTLKIGGSAFPETLELMVYRL
jgi:hypothetical protein